MAVALALAYYAIAFAMAVSFLRIERKLPDYPLSMLRFDAVIVLLGAAHCVAIWAVLQRISGRPFWLQAVVAALLVLIFALAFDYEIWLAIGSTLGVSPPSFAPVNLVRFTIFWSAPFGVWAAGVLAVMHEAASRRRERQLAEARALAHEAQMRALRYQINPHFLYNTLNSIASLILDQRNDVAEAMVIRLSDFFRSSLAQDPLADTSLAAEVALQRLYLDIEELRFADQLQVRVDVPAELEAAQVPSLILQPLVENALKHGLRGPGQPMDLHIGARAKGDRLVIEVADDGRGSAAQGGGTGVGLVNVERRLAARFPGQAGLEVDSTAAGFRARLTMPLRYA